MRDSWIEPEVVTDLDPDGPEAGREHRQPIAGAEHDALLHPGQRPEVHLVVRAEQPVRTDDGHRVAEHARLVRVAFGQAEQDVHVVLAGEIGDVVGRRAGDLLGLVDVELARVALAAARRAGRGTRQRLLGEGDDVDALGRGLDDVGLDLLERALLVAPDRREVGAADGHDLLERLILNRDHADMITGS
jgi:hypothetical protein